MRTSRPHYVRQSHRTLYGHTPSNHEFFGTEHEYLISLEHADC